MATNAHFPSLHDDTYRWVEDNDTTEVRDHQDHIFAKGIGSEDGLEYITGSHPRDRQLQGRWIEYKVLRRARPLYDPERLEEGGSAWKRMAWSSARIMSGVREEPHAYGPCSAGFRAFWGWSPISILPATGSSPTSSHDQGGLSRDDDLENSIIKDLNGVTLGHQVVLHASMSIPGNITASKALLNHGSSSDWSLEADAATEEAIRHAYPGEHIDSLKFDLTHSVETLATGMSAEPFVRYSLPPSTPLPETWTDSQDLDSLVRPSDSNRTWREALPRGLPYIRHSLEGPVDHSVGFVYGVPFLKLMIFEPSLYTHLEAFAMAHKQDKFDAQALLFAAVLWTDIVDHRTQMQESTMEISPSALPGRPLVDEEVPLVTLAEFLLYFEHWLRWHDIHQPLEYIHPFRWIKAMYEGDKKRGPEFWVQPSSLNDDEVATLVRLAVSCDYRIPPDARFQAFPSSWHSASTPFPTKMGPYVRPPKMVEALIGLGSPRQYGLPTYSHAQDNEMRILIPEPIAAKLYGGQATPLEYQLSLTEMRWIFYESRHSPYSLFGKEKGSGRIWAPNFSPHVDQDQRQLLYHQLQPMMARSEPAALPIRTILTPFLQARLQAHGRQTLARYAREGILNIPEGQSPEVDEFGHLMIRGGPADIHPADLRNQGNYTSYRARRLQGNSETHQPIAGRPNQVLTQGELERVIEQVKTRPVPAHWALFDCEVSLRQYLDGAQFSELRTVQHILTVIEDALNDAESDLMLLSANLEMLDEDVLRVGNGNYGSWLTGTVSRFNGIPATPSADQYPTWANNRDLLQDRDPFQVSAVDMILNLTTSGTYVYQGTDALMGFGNIIKPLLRRIHDYHAGRIAPPTFVAVRQTLRDYMENTTAEMEWPPRLED